MSAVWPLALVLTVPLLFDPYTFDPFVLPKQLALLLLAGTALLWTARAGIVLPRSRLILVGLAIGAVAELLAFLLASDRLGAIMGNLNYRMGLASHLAIATLFLTALGSIRSETSANRVLRFGLVALAIVVAYALLQFFGGEPFHWTATGPAVFSTLGNPNDLASYCVLSVGCLAVLMPFSSRRRRLAFAAALAGIAAVVVMSESRSGVVGLLMALAALPLLAHLNRWPAATVRYLGIATLGVVAVGMVTAASSGDAPLLLNRFGRAFSTSPTETASIRTRVDIWRGSLAVFEQHPLFGVGQDGLLVNFNRDRPGDLGPPFNESSSTGSDPLVGSPHSFPLEVLVTLGPLGAIAAALLVAWLSRTYWGALRRSRSDTLPFLGAGAIGYLAIAALNPLSLSVVAQAAVFAGIIGGLAPGNVKVFTLRPGTPARALGTAAAILVPVLCMGAVLLLWTDREAFQASVAAAAGNDRRAVQLSGNAAEFVPFEAAYRRQHVQALANLAFSSHDASVMQEANREQALFLSDFPGLPSDFLTLARIRLALGGAGVSSALDAAKAASPAGVNTAGDVASISAALARTGATGSAAGH